MKKILKFIAAALLIAGAFSCTKDTLPAGADTSSLRISLTPAPGTIDAAGKTFKSMVVVHQGPSLDVKWTASVDLDPDWISVQEVTVDGSFTGTYAGDDTTYSHPGISVVVKANTTGAKRSANLRFSVADGGSIIYTITQSK